MDDCTVDGVALTLPQSLISALKCSLPSAYKMSDFVIHPGLVIATVLSCSHGVMIVYLMLHNVVKCGCFVLCSCGIQHRSPVLSSNPLSKLANG